MGQAEPWLERDKAMIDQLEDHRYRKGQSLQSRQKTKEILNEAIHEAKAWLDSRLETLNPYYEGERWFRPFTEEFIQNIMMSLADTGFFPG